jgi:alanyl-tRNA synthetase
MNTILSYCITGSRQEISYSYKLMALGVPYFGLPVTADNMLLKDGHLKLMVEERRKARAKRNMEEQMMTKVGGGKRDRDSEAPGMDEQEEEDDETAYLNKEEKSAIYCFLHTITAPRASVSDAVRNARHRSLVFRMCTRLTLYGAVVNCRVDYDQRRQIAPNHSMTHVLNAALRQVLGENVDRREVYATTRSFDSISVTRKP